jgi:hypothetical protein
MSAASQVFTLPGDEHPSPAFLPGILMLATIRGLLGTLHEYLRFITFLTALSEYVAFPAQTDQFFPHFFYRPYPISTFL